MSLLSRSDFFKGMLNSNLKEQAERKATLDMTTKATEQFVKFLYGFELDNLNIDIVKELMEYGQMYLIDSLQKAAGKKLDVLLLKDNVFELLQFFSNKKNNIGMDFCIDFVSRNFEKEFLFKSGHFKQYPELCQKILELEMVQKMANPKTPMRGDADSMRMAFYDTFLGER